jgi:hypothetical protein
MSNFTRPKTKKSRDGPDPELVRQIQRKLLIAGLVTVAAVVVLLYVLPRI